MWARIRHDHPARAQSLARPRPVAHRDQRRVQVTSHCGITRLTGNRQGRRGLAECRGVRYLTPARIQNSAAYRSQRLRHPVDAELMADPGDRPTRVPCLRPQLEDHLHCPFPQLSGMRLPGYHEPQPSQRSQPPRNPGQSIPCLTGPTGKIGPVGEGDGLLGAQFSFAHLEPTSRTGHGSPRHPPSTRST